jgi:hypothetical protein
MTTVQDGGKVVSLTHRPPLPPGNAPGTHFCQRLSRLRWTDNNRNCLTKVRDGAGQKQLLYYLKYDNELWAP